MVLNVLLYVYKKCIQVKGFAHGVAKLIAGKCKHSDSKFTGSSETTRKLQKKKKKLIQISFQTSTIFYKNVCKVKLKGMTFFWKK